jgi:hypothetical protein
MSGIVFLLEERSAKILLEGLLPRLFPGLPFTCISHEGKRDLELSIPRKLKAWREPGTRFIILRDNDSANCVDLKQKLVELTRGTGRAGVVVRIACQELEAWYLGDPEALADAFSHPALAALKNSGRFQDPDAVSQPSRALQHLEPGFQKISGARLMSSHLTRDGNRSRSYNVFIESVLSQAGTIGWTPPVTPPPNDVPLT